MAQLPKNLKDAAEDAFQENPLLFNLAPQEREQAAQWYEAVAARTVGIRADLARLYNLERAKFLRGQVVRIAPDAPEFAREIGYSSGGKP